MVCVIISYVHFYDHCHLQVILETEPLFREKRTNKAEQPTLLLYLQSQHKICCGGFYIEIMTALKSRRGCAVAEVLLGAKSLSGECLQSLSADCGSPLELGDLTSWGLTRLPSPAQMHCLLVGMGRLPELLLLSFRWKSCQTGDASATCQHSSRLFCFVLFFLYWKWYWELLVTEGRSQKISG